MPTVTVLAPDSALAMDEVIRQLGDNAYILATHTRDGQVEILATNEPTQIQPPRKRLTTVSFADAIFEQVAQAGGTVPIFSSARAAPAQNADLSPEQTPSHSAVIVAMPQARPRPTPAAAVTHTEAVRAAAQPATTGEDTIVERLHSAVPFIDAPPAPAAQPTEPEPKTATGVATEPDPAPDLATGPDADLRPLLRELAAQLARLEATMSPPAHAAGAPRDPLEAAGLSPTIIQRLAPARTAPDRKPGFVAAMAKALIAPAPLASLRAPVVMIVGPSGAGKTVLAGKIAAMTLDTQKTRTVELVSLSETPPLVDSPLPIYARMLSIRHRTWQPNQLDPDQMSMLSTTSIIDTNLDPETLHRKLDALRTAIGRTEVVVIVALPAGISPARARAELERYSRLDPIIALTKLDECELSLEEASVIAEAGTQIAWLSGTRALTETMAPATEDMMTEFLTGLLADRI